MNENIQNDVNLRNETDLYGYSLWLSKKLKLPFTPISLRGFQHGWIWWDVNLLGAERDLGLDPNLNTFWGELVQDKTVEAFLIKNSIFSKACGLPFLSFLENEESSEVFPQRIKGSILYVPPHSNPWHDEEEAVKTAIDCFPRHPNSAVLLSSNDAKLSARYVKYFRIEIGAGALQSRSFYRLARIFRTYEYMISCSMGSHIRYAAACGMKVGILRKPFEICLQPQVNSFAGYCDKQQLIDKNSDLKDMFIAIQSASRINNWHPGLFIDDISDCQFVDFPKITCLKPIEIAKLLGWEITFQSEFFRKINSVD